MKVCAHLSVQSCMWLEHSYMLGGIERENYKNCGDI